MVQLARAGKLALNLQSGYGQGSNMSFASEGNQTGEAPIFNIIQSVNIDNGGEK
jgi:hypothetical protein